MTRDEKIEAIRLIRENNRLRELALRLAEELVAILKDDRTRRMARVDVLALLILCVTTLSALAQSTTGKPFSILSAATTNCTLVYNDRALGKALHVINTTATTYYLKLYDKKTTPVAGTDTPNWRVPVPPQNTGGGVIGLSLEDLQFFSGVGLCLTGGILDSDSSNAATGVAINLSFFPQ